MKRIALFLYLSVSSFALGMSEHPIATDLAATAVAVPTQKSSKKIDETKPKETHAHLSPCYILPRAQSTSNIYRLTQALGKEKQSPNLDTNAYGETENEFLDLFFHKANWKDTITAFMDTRAYINSIMRYVSKASETNLIKFIRSNSIGTFFIMRHAQDGETDKVHEANDPGITSCKITISNEIRKEFQIFNTNVISVCTSDKSRNILTAQTLFGKTDIDNNFEEITFPQLSGMNKTKASLSGLIIKMFTDVKYKDQSSQSAESIHDVIQRVFNGLLKLHNEDSLETSKHVIVANYAIMNAILRFFCREMRKPLIIPYLSGFVVTVFPALNMVSIYTENDEPVIFDTSAASLNKVKTLLSSPEEFLMSGKDHKRRTSRPLSPICQMSNIICNWANLPSFASPIIDCS